VALPSRPAARNLDDVKTPGRYAAAAALAFALAGGLAACGGGDPAALTTAPEPPAECVPILDARFDEDGLRSAHRQARELGESRGKIDAEDFIHRRTRDGYRFRHLASGTIMSAGLLLSGMLVGVLLLALLLRRPTVRYSERLGASIEREIGAIRAALTDDSEACAALDRVRPTLADAEAANKRLTEVSSSLEHEGRDPEVRARLETFYARMERLAASVDRLRVRVEVWKERLEADGSQAQAVDAAISAALEAFDLGEEGHA